MSKLTALPRIKLPCRIDNHRLMKHREKSVVRKATPAAVTSRLGLRCINTCSGRSRKESIDSARLAARVSESMCRSLRVCERECL